jgi:hypothetical protein
MERKGEKAFCSPVKFKLRWDLVAQCQSRNQKLLSIPCKWDLRVPQLGESQADLSPPLHLFKRNVFTSLFLFLTSSYHVLKLPLAQSLTQTARFHQACSCPQPGDFFLSLIRSGTLGQSPWLGKATELTAMQNYFLALNHL